MMNVTQLTDKLNSMGYRKSAASRNEEGSLRIVDFSHKKRPTMFSLFINAYGSVEYAEKTDIKWDDALHRYTPIVRKITGLAEFNKVLR